MNLQFPGQPPTDPRYLAFIDGLGKVVTNTPAGWTYAWWHPYDAHWYPYPGAAWLSEDVGAPNTPPGSAMQEAFGDDFKPKWSLNQFELPDLFKNVDAADTSLRQRFPQANLAWTPWGGGEWRSMNKRATPPATPDLPPEALRRIEQVHEWVRRGDITEAFGQQLINEIVEESTRSALR